jgi:hypothetical protein
MYSIIEDFSIFEDKYSEFRLEFITPLKNSFDDSLKK